MPSTYQVSLRQVALPLQDFFTSSDRLDVFLKSTPPNLPAVSLFQQVLILWNDDTEVFVALWIQNDRSELGDFSTLTHSEAEKMVSPDLPHVIVAQQLIVLIQELS
jgi:hypothetical protein